MIKYVVMAILDISNSHINASTSNNLSGTRANNDSSKAILKFSDTDDVARNVFINETWKTKEEIINDTLTLADWIE